MIWYAGPEWAELDRTGPNRTVPDHVGTHRTVIQQNTSKCAIAHAKHETLTSYWSTNMDNVKLELLTTNDNKGC